MAMKAKQGVKRATATKKTAEKKVMSLKKAAAPALKNAGKKVASVKKRVNKALRAGADAVEQGMEIVSQGAGKVSKFITKTLGSSAKKSKKSKTKAR